MVSLSTGSLRAPLADRGNDLYETPPEAVHALLKVETLPPLLWEPACGRGAIARILRDAGHSVWATDLVDYGYENSESGIDFLMERQTRKDIQAIVTNPPFKNTEGFVARALELAPKVIMLLRLAFMESEKRTPILDGGMLARVHVFRKRLPMMHRDGWAGRRANSGMAFAWFVWDRFHSAPTTIHRISWDR